MTSAPWAREPAPARRVGLHLVVVPATEAPCDASFGVETPDRPSGPFSGAAGTRARALPIARTAAVQRVQKVRKVQGVQGVLSLSTDSGEPAAAVRGPRPASVLRGESSLQGLEVRRWAALFVAGLVEVASGQRPMSQLSRWTTFDVYESLQWALGVRPVRNRQVHGTGSRPRRARALSVHVSVVTEDVAEGCATIRWDGRARALAFRVEVHPSGWRCTAATLL